jgi:hypothetical protein
MTIGCQGSGKSTWAKMFIAQNLDILYLSTDKIRTELGYDESDQTVTSLVYERMNHKTEDALKKGQSVLLDATFIRKDWRRIQSRGARIYQGNHQECGRSRVDQSHCGSTGPSHRTFEEDLKPGMRDFEVLAEAQYSTVRSGSERQLIQVGSGPPGTPVGFHLRHFQNRMIKEGDQFSS